MSDTKPPAAAGNGRADRAGAAAPPRGVRAPRRNGAISRHGAISLELTEYASYKSWAEKVRNAWREERDRDPAEPAPRPSRR